jgi:hypothetical protein
LGGGDDDDAGGPAAGDQIADQGAEFLLLSFGADGDRDGMKERGLRSP